MKLTALIDGLAIGAIAMYFLDPDRGKARQSEAKDQYNAFLKNKQKALDVMVEDFQNRAQGLNCEVQAALRNEPVTDEVVYSRVQSALGHAASHPKAIVVGVSDGEVLLSGDILENDVQEVVHAVEAVRGVKRVENRLDVHAEAGNVPALQGQGTRPEDGRWNPATCLVLGSGGALLTLYGLAKRGILGTLCCAAGTIVIARSFADTESRFQSEQDALPEPESKPKQRSRRSSSGKAKSNKEDSASVL